MRRFVFVPLAGPNTSADWLLHPHTKVWGFLDDGQLTAVHVKGDIAECTPLNIPFAVFDEEMAQAIDIPENSTDLPDEVCIALAKLALLPVSRAN